MRFTDLAAVYFPFLDGMLGYDCARCGSQCCKGLGTGFTPAELVPLLLRRPEVAPFVQVASSHQAFQTFTEGCFFLAPDGLCRIEVAEGRAAKPSVCRAFPFNRIHRAGEILVVEPQMLRCPIEERAGHGVTWAEVFADLASMGEGLPSVASQLPPGAPDDWVVKERAWVLRSADFLDEREPIAMAAAQPGGDRKRLASLGARWHRSTHSFWA